MTMTSQGAAVPRHDRSFPFLGRQVPLDPRVLVEAAVTDVRSMPRSLKAWLAFLLGIIAVGGVAAVIALPPGWEVFGTSPSVEWGLLIVAYVAFAITTSGLCLASSLGTVFGIDRFRPLEKRHAILAVLCLTSAFGIIALDLHWPIRLVFGAVLSPSPTSPMWWMGVFYGGYLCLLLVEVWSMFSDHPRIHQWACTLAAGMAILAPATLGAVFGVLVARPYWNGPFTPILMVASAFLSGVAVLGIVFAVVVRLQLSGHERAGTLAIPALRGLLGLGLFVVAVLVARHLAAGLIGDARGLHEATEAVLRGPLAMPFWVIRVGLGLALPLLLIVLPITRTPTGLLVASVAALAGVFADRWLFVAAGQIAPVTASAGVVSDPYAVYGPSPVEVAIVLAAAAFVALGYTLAERYLDLRESELHFGFQLAPAIGRIRDTGLALYRTALTRLPRPREAAPPEAAPPEPDEAAMADVAESGPPAGLLGIAPVPSDEEVSAECEPPEPPAVADEADG